MKAVSSLLVGLFVCLAFAASAAAQTPVPMASQPGLSYTEDFANISSWTNNFTAGTGANRFGSVAVNSTGTIPDGIRTTVSSATFQTTGSSGGIQKGSLTGNPLGTFVFLSTGPTDNTSAVAVDFFMNFTGVNAGTLSFDWKSVNNSTGDRNSSLRVYWSTDGSTFTELTGAQVLNFTNNSLTSGSITTVQLPSQFSNCPTARLRFYEYNGTGGTTGSRPKIAIDNLKVTAAAIPPGVTLTPTNGSTDVTEGGSTDTYTVVLNTQPTANVSIAMSPDFQTTVSPTSLTFTPADWNTPQTVTVTAVDDNVYEGNHTGTVQHFASSADTAYSGIAVPSVTANITDNDTVPVMEFGFVSQNFEERNGFGAGYLVVKRVGGAAGNTVTVNYGFTDGTAIGGGLCDGTADFNNNTGSVTVFANSTEGSLPIYLCNDSNPESTESFTATLSNPSGGILGTQTSTTANILDDDNSTMELAATAFQAAEDTTAQITVTRSGNTSGASSVSYTTSDGTAVQGICGQSGVDYVPSYGTLQFAAGETSKTISVTLCGDTDSESPAETIGLTLSSPSGGTLGTNASATITVLDAASEFRNHSQLQYVQGGPAVASTVNVSGYFGPVSGVKVTLYGVTTAKAETLDALLVSPNGAKFVVTSMVGGNNPLSGATLTFEDVATDYLPFGSAISPGKNYKPTSCTTPVTNFGSPAPDGPYLEPGCDGNTPGSPTFASAFGGVNPTGTWTLYVRDNTGLTTSLPTGVVGSTISAGWGLQFRAPTAASGSISGRVRTPDGRGIQNAVVTIEGGGLASPVTVVTSSFGMYRFDNIPAGQTYVVTVKAKRFAFEMPSRTVSVTDDLAGVDFVAVR